MQGLTRGEQKALALHRWLAERVRADPSLLIVVRKRLGWLRERNPAGVPYHNEWSRLVEGPLDMLLDTMISPAEHACSLRQESPFVDLVDQRARARIYREVAEAIDGAVRS